MRWTNLSWGCTAALAVVACGAPQKPAAPLASPQARVARIFPKPDSLDVAKIAVTVEVFNPRSTPIELLGLDYTIDAGDLAASVEGRATATGTLNAEEGAEVEFTASLALPTDADAYKATLERGTVPIDINGVARFADGSTAKFARKGAFAAPSLPKLVIHDAQAARYDGNRGIDVTLFLRLINENSFTVVVDELRYEVGVNGKTVKQGKDLGVRLVGSAVSEYEESAVLDRSTVGRAGVRALLADGEVHYSVDGEVDVRNLVLPFKLEGTVDLGSSDE